MSEYGSWEELVAMQAEIRDLRRDVDNLLAELRETQGQLKDEIQRRRVLTARHDWAEMSRP